MSRIEKLRQRLLSRPADFTWQELVTVMTSYGYRLSSGTGSRRSFQQEGHDAFYLHEPHPGSILKRYQVSLTIVHLQKEGHL